MYLIIFVVFSYNLIIQNDSYFIEFNSDSLLLSFLFNCLNSTFNSSMAMHLYSKHNNKNNSYQGLFIVFFIFFFLHFISKDWEDLEVS